MEGSTVGLILALSWLSESYLVQTLEVLDSLLANLDDPLKNGQKFKEFIVVDHKVNGSLFVFDQAQFVPQLSDIAILVDLDDLFNRVQNLFA